MRTTGAASACPRLSVIIPTCGRIPLLLECVQSILRNDFTDYEVLIVDQEHGSALPAALAGRFGNDPRLVYLWLEEASISRARNLGISRARGEILIFADDDIVVDPGWLRAYVEAFEAPAVPPGAVAGRLDPCWLVPRPAWFPEDREYLLGIYNRHDRFMPMPEHDLPIGANFAVLRKVADEVGPFDERIGYSYARRDSMIGGEDSLFSLRIKQANYRLYHQPAARVWHKVAGYKVTRWHFLRRNFWEGFTLVTVMYLSGAISAATALPIARWHVKHIVLTTVRRLLPGRRPGTVVPATPMALLALYANSLGVIRAALRLRRRGRLP